MDVVGVNVDIPVRSLDDARAFYETVIGRAPDLTPPSMVEWILHRDPEVALRLVDTDTPAPGSAQFGIGVADLEAEHTRLRTLLSDTLEVSTKPGVIAKLELKDPSDNHVTLWQDLLERADG